MRKLWLNFDGEFMRKYLTISIVVIVYSIFLLSCNQIDYEKQRTFIKPVAYERQKWFGLDEELGRETEWEFRPKMARDLIGRNILIGKSREEIIEMLGKDGDYGLYSPNKIRYELEQIYGRNIDPIAIENLIMTFNRENRVEKAEIEFHKTADWENYR